jgi:hypothetical protein
LSVRRRPPHIVRFHLRRLVIESAALGSGRQIEVALRSALAQAFSAGCAPEDSRDARPMPVAHIANAVSATTWSHPSVSAVAARPAAGATTR